MWNRQKTSPTFEGCILHTSYRIIYYIRKQIKRAIRANTMASSTITRGQYFMAAILLILLSSSNLFVLQVNAEVCSLCPNEEHTPLAGDGASFYVSSAESFIRCNKAEELASTGYFSNCTALHNQAAEICGCGIPSNETFSCQLCGEGNELPFPDRVVANKTCPEWQNDASNDFEKDCFVWQKSLGTYCGCDVSAPKHFDGFCRICNDTILSKPNKTVTFQGSIGVYTESCASLEQDLNTRSGFDCELDVQNVYSKRCDCGWDIELPKKTPTSPERVTASGPKSKLTSFASILPFVLLALFL